MAGDLPRKARFVIRVGVTGHRLLEQHGFRDEASLRARVRELVVDLGQLAHRLYERRAELGERWLFDGDRKPVLRVTTALAMGADQLVAREAIEAATNHELGHSDLELAVLLPAPEAEYLDGSTFRVEREKPAGDEGAAAEDAEASRREQAAKAGFQTLRTDTKVRGVAELDGRMDRDHEAEAYSALGQLLLGQVDALIAVWDEKEGGRGGTAEVVRTAKELGIPVAVIRATPTGLSEVSANPDPVPPLPVPGPFRHCSFVSAVADLVLFSEAPPEQLEKKTLWNRIPRRLRRPLARRGDLRCTFFESETSPEQRFRGLPLRWSRLWGRALKRFGGEDRSHAHWVDEAAPVESPPSSFASHYEQTDALAGYYAGLYRLSFTLLAALGALAVAFALFSLAEAGAGRGHGHLSWAVVAELVAISSMAAIFVIMVWNHWHEKSIDYRLLAEQLRQMEFLAPLGLAPGSTRPLVAYEEGKIERDWTNRHFRALVREYGLERDLRFTAEELEVRRLHLRVAWIANQLCYHDRTAHRNHRLNELLERLALTFFALTFVLCLLHLPHCLKDFHGAIAFLCALLPALAAACHAISAQGELRRVARRSEAMTKVLGSLAERLKPTKSPLRWRDMAKIAQDASRVMLEETVEWRVVLLNHPPHAPG